LSLVPAVPPTGLSRHNIEPNGQRWPASGSARLLQTPGPKAAYRRIRFNPIARDLFRSAAVRVLLAALMPRMFVIITTVAAVIVAFARCDDARRCERDQSQQKGDVDDAGYFFHESSVAVSVDRPRSGHHSPDNVAGACHRRLCVSVPSGTQRSAAVRSSGERRPRNAFSLTSPGIDPATATSALR